MIDFEGRAFWSLSIVNLLAEPNSESQVLFTRHECDLCKVICIIDVPGHLPLPHTLRLDKSRDIGRAPLFIEACNSKFKNASGSQLPQNPFVFLSCFLDVSLKELTPFCQSLPCIEPQLPFFVAVGCFVQRRPACSLFLFPCTLMYSGALVSSVGLLCRLEVCI